MTTNHPAHGPVSLERLHQIREHLQHDTQHSNGGNRDYILADMLKVIDVAIASFGAAPVLYAAEETLAYAKMGELHLKCLSHPMGDAVIPLYTAPPAPVSPDKMTVEMAYPRVQTNWHDANNFAEGWNACLAAMLQSLGNSQQLDEVGSWNNHRNTPTANPAIDTGELLKHIEGMEVSVDVSTCDADTGHRYFGTVTEISELDTAKNGYILLVQDAKPNFNHTEQHLDMVDHSVDANKMVAGNSPATPDGWIPVSERMPNKLIPVMVMYEDGEMWSAMWNGNRWDDGTEYPDPNSVTHWCEMPAAPQQEVKSALEHGMQRYAGAMQKLSEGDD